MTKKVAILRTRDSWAGTMKTRYFMANQNWFDMTIGFLLMTLLLKKYFQEINLVLFGVAEYMPPEMDSLNGIRHRMMAHFYTVTRNWLSIMELFPEKLS
mgnify:CR=1 FL=1